MSDGSVLCGKCNHHELYFKTAQLRSADEGQTIFYECARCAYVFLSFNGLFWLIISEETCLTRDELSALPPCTGSLGLLIAELFANFVEKCKSPQALYKVHEIERMSQKKLRNYVQGF